MSPARRRPPSKRTRASSARTSAEAGGAFWSTSPSSDDALDALDALGPLGAITVADDPAVVVRSLGPVPLAGREPHAERYFAAVYDKAAALATALAATVDLLHSADAHAERSE